MLTYRLFNTITGDPIGIPIHCQGSWRDSMTSVGSGSFDLPISKLSRFTPAQWQNATAHWRATLVEFWDDVPMFAGVIEDKTWDYWREVLTLKTVTVDDFLRNRYPFGVGGGYNLAPFQVVSKSLRAALMAAIRRGSGEVWGSEWDLPFRFHISQSEAGTFSKVWENADWATMQNMVDLIRGMAGGPDLAFIPAMNGEKLLWDVMIGNPRITGATATVSLSVREARVTSPKVTEAGARMRSGAFVRGEGVGIARPHGEAGFMAGPAMPVRDTARTVADINDQSILDAMALGDLQAHRRPTNQHQFSLHLNGGKHPYPVEAAKLGSRIRLLHSGDGYKPAFTETGYVVARSHNSRSPGTIIPEVQPL